MRTVYIKPGPFGLEYKTESNSSRWSYLPRDIKDVNSIKRFFEEGRDRSMRGQYDTPALTFVDEQGRPTSYYHVTRDKRVTANFDPTKTLILDPDHFRSPIDQIEYLKSLSDEDTIQAGIEKETVAEERDYLLSKARPETVKAFNEYVRAGMTPKLIESYCSAHAKTRFKSGAIVSFDE